MNPEKEILNLNINDVIPNRFQPRLSFEDDSLQELSKSISEHGIIQPLVVRRAGEKFEIIAGERRYKAATMAGLTSVPAIVVNLDDAKSAEVALIENIQRKNLSAIEEAKSYQKILDMGGLTQEALASRLGKSQSFIANKVRLLTLSSQVQDALMHNKISERHARSLLAIKDEVEQNKMLERITNERMTVRQTDRAVEDLINPEPEGEELDEMANMNNIIAPKEGKETTNLNTEVETLDLGNQPPPAPPVTTSNVEPLKTEVDSTEIKTLGEERKVFDPTAIINQPAPMQTSMGDAPNPLYQPGPPASEPSPSSPATNKLDLNQLLAVDGELEEPAIKELPSSSEQGLSKMPNIMNDPFLKTDGVANFEPKPIEAPPVISSDYKSAINAIRENIKILEKHGTKIETEEFDFDSIYQIIIKLDK